jgi:hypothetical protein
MDAIYKKDDFESGVRHQESQVLQHESPFRGVQSGNRSGSSKPAP